MKHQLFVYAALAICFTASAGEYVIIGETKSGVFYAFSPTNLSADTDAVKGAVSEQRLDLVIKKYVPTTWENPKTKKQEPAVTLGVVASEVPVACSWMLEEKPQQIICSHDATHGLANVRYVRSNSKDRFRCVQSCSRKVPSILKIEDVESGC
jgi:hypothetical protein